ncbi:DUF418 domain-containing protein [Salicibibacter halophilus]|uniref:DUF418 domain-containing protein n=1 Tax=Salicibibacter halophilus TaxID=2502791 RepID=A0A514LIT8_9BACI|nr:DUF418 domain-containing protein [Salicibibacter halophilus]QDI91445.1 DUF418 domain-containing protein [Salicibibacter halophilus]
MTSAKKEDQASRIEILDQMRGIALLVIFLVNIPGLAEVMTMERPSINESLRDLVDIIFADTARPLFAFMFGISLILIYNRLKEKNINPYPTLFRRMLILFFIGAVHGFFIWTGDILLMYASAGFVLLFFLKLSRKSLLVTALLFWLGFTIGTDFFSYDLDNWLKGLLGSGENPKGWDYLMIEFTDMINHMGFFLFGMYAYRIGIFSLVPEQRKITGLLTFIFLSVGLAGKTGLHYELDSFFLNNLDGFYAFMTTMGIVLAIILWGTSRAKAVLLPFAAIGKMTFTNYLLQSLVFVSLFTLSGRTIFDGTGFWTEPSYVFALVTGILFFMIQMVYSHFWLKKYRYGPFEWLWRTGTYMKVVPIKK